MSWILSCKRSGGSLVMITHELKLLQLGSRNFYSFHCPAKRSDQCAGVRRRRIQSSIESRIYNISAKGTQQNSYSISHSLHCDYMVIAQWWLLTAGSMVTTLPLATQSPCCWQLTTVTTPSLSSHHVVTVQRSDWWNSSQAVYTWLLGHLYLKIIIIHPKNENVVTMQHKPACKSVSLRFWFIHHLHECHADIK